MNAYKPSLIGLSLAFFSLTACHQIKQKAGSAVNAAGETVGKAGSEFVNGVSDGIDHTMSCTIELSKPLEAAGLSYGKFKIVNGSPAQHILRVYLIFNQEINRSVSIKVFDNKGAEYGRTTASLTGLAGSANYFDFVFDSKTEIESQSHFVIE